MSDEPEIYSKPELSNAERTRRVLRGMMPIIERLLHNPESAKQEGFDEAALHFLESGHQLIMATEMVGQGAINLHQLDAMGDLLLLKSDDPEEREKAALNNPELMDAAGAASMLGMSEMWVREHTTRTPPIVPHVRLGKFVRYERSEIAKFITAQRESKPSWERKKKA